MSKGTSHIGWVFGEICRPLIFSDKKSSPPFFNWKKTLAPYFFKKTLNPRFFLPKTLQWKLFYELIVCIIRQWTHQGHLTQHRFLFDLQKSRNLDLFCFHAFTQWEENLGFNAISQNLGWKLVISKAGKIKFSLIYGETKRFSRITQTLIILLLLLSFTGTNIWIWTSDSEAKGDKIEVVMFMKPNKNGGMIISGKGEDNEGDRWTVSGNIGRPK